MMLRFDFPKTFSDLLDEQSPLAYGFTRTHTPAMDVAENEHEFVAYVELPGVRKEDVKISFEKDVLTVEGVRKSFELPQEARVLLNEVSAQEFTRSIRIPAGIDAANISAELDNGILKIQLPKSQEARVRTIAIK